MSFWHLYRSLLNLSVSGIMGCAFPSVTWRWCSVIGVPSVSLSTPSVSQCDLAVAQCYWHSQCFPQCSSVFVVFLQDSLHGQPSLLFLCVGWLALWPGGQRVPAAVCALIPMCVACLCLRAFGSFVVFFCIPSLPPSFPFFLFLFLVIHSLIQCDRSLGVLPWGGGGGVRGWGAGGHLLNSPIMWPVIKVPMSVF